jgi:hypothetical protein
VVQDELGGLIKIEGRGTPVINCTKSLWKNVATPIKITSEMFPAERVALHNNVKIFY